MRVSVRESDKGYTAKAFDCEVYLDGKKIQNCFTADEELGVAYCYKTDEQGEVVIDPETGNSLVEIERHGDVKII